MLPRGRLPFGCSPPHEQTAVIIVLLLASGNSCVPLESFSNLAQVLNEIQGSCILLHEQQVAARRVGATLAQSASRELKLPFGRWRTSQLLCRLRVDPQPQKWAECFEPNFQVQTALREPVSSPFSALGRQIRPNVQQKVPLSSALVVWPASKWH